MFTGIIECIGIVHSLEKEQSNLVITIESSISNELKIDQSLAHNGVCLTVTSFDKAKNTHTVVAIEETLNKSNLKNIRVGELINLERAMRLGDRLDGHIVQGHVDQTAVCVKADAHDGSWIFGFEYDAKLQNITIEKGSITLNGVSLTVVNSGDNSFEVAIIPFTLEHTNFNSLKKGDLVNLEFDVIGKYVTKLLKTRS
ncbi:MAG: riboflavin synthase [Flavobacteriaceae bacterium]|nr:riboflavin synthase [Flavobacteriaceae bacterium]MDZ4148393.1 riboflavin synthase [Flavobacteriaceae bacterium]